MENFDIVVVGAGSSGCIVANQLVTKTKYKILLIEAGPSDNNPIVKVPLGYGMTFYNKRLNWNFYSKRQKNLFNREIYFPRGKVMGGSGSINAMVYTRGIKSDYQNWNNNNDLWSWSNIKRTYEEIEKKISNRDYSNTTNKIFVNDVSNFHHSISKSFFDASMELGININKNLTTDILDQVGHYNINTKNGYRYTSSDAFIKPIIKEKNLKILKNSIVEKINFKNNTISEIELLNNGKKISIKPNIGAILCSGSIMTPHILMHSGIGPADHLKKFNINVVVNSPNVGKNLQDHIGLDYGYISKVETLNKLLGTWKGRIGSIVQYLYNQTGPLALSINQCGGYINWKSRNNLPNLQIYFNPLSYSITYKNKRPLLKTDKFNGFVIGFNPCRPKSKGSVLLSSNNFNNPPIIDPNYLDQEEDIYDLKCAFDITKKYLNTKNLNNIIKQPINIDLLKSTDEDLINHFKKNANSVYHPCGTCRMDNNIKLGVVSDKLKVHGINNLWVVDASIFPSITSGNINAPVMMVAHRSSQIIINELNEKK